MKRGIKKMGGWLVGGMILMCMMAAGVLAQDGGAVAPVISAKPGDPFVKGAKPVQGAAVAEPQAAAVVEPQPVVEAQQPPQIEINVSLVSFPREEVEILARLADSASPAEEQILKAWRGGKGRLVASHKMASSAGQEMTAKSVTEHIYPTQFSLTEPEGTNGAVKAVSAIVPINMETREVGFITTCTATLSEDRKTISATLSLEYVVRGDDHEITAAIEAKGVVAAGTKVSLPNYHAQRVQVSKNILNGATVVEGGMLSHDGGEMGYFFITPRVVGM